MNHHYVPQCYLKQFLNTEKKLAVLNLELLKQRGKFKVGFFTESSICYDVDYYKIKSQEDSDSPYKELNKYEPHHVEKVVFSSFENNFSTEYSALINEPKKLINKSFWANGIVSLKKRNPYYLAIQRFDTITSGAFANLRTELKKITDDPDAFEALRIITGKITNDPNAKQKFYLSSLIHDSESKNNLKDIEQIITTLSWELLIADEKYPFITTDKAI